MSRWAIDNSSFSRSCSLLSFLFEKSVAKMSHASFGVLVFPMCYNMSSSTVVFRANMAFLALIFHFCRAPLVSSSGYVTSLPPTTSQRSWPCR
ncbi:hypothetical protein ACFX2C_015622 [Malus domestica]